MNWKKLFKYLIEDNLLDSVIQKIENNEKFSSSDNKLNIESATDKKNKGVEYDFKSKLMFTIQFEEGIVTVGHKFLLDSFKSQKLKQELLINYPEDFTFFDFQFMLYMHYAADVSSGFSHFRSSVKEISKSLEIGRANLNGIWIKNEDELNVYLTQHIHGFESLFHSVEEIKNYA